MTPERKKLIAKWRAHCDVNHGPNDGLCAACADAAITEAVAEKQEQCAKVAEQFQDIIGWQPGESRNKVCFDIAAAIRRGRHE